MTKLHKTPPPASTGLRSTLPGSLQAGVKYEDLPVSPLYLLPSLSLEPHQTALPSQPLGTASASNSPCKSAAQGPRANQVLFPSTTRRVDQPTSPPEPSAGYRAHSAPPNTCQEAESNAQGVRSEMMPSQPLAQAPSPGHSPPTRQHGDTTCPRNCTKCGKHRFQSVDPSRNRSREHIPDGTSGLAVDPLPIHHAKTKACGPNCTKCGKRRTAPSSSTGIGTSDQLTNNLQEAPQAHTRSFSEGNLRSGTPLPPLRIDAGPSWPLSGQQYNQCHSCGKPKKPAWMRDVAQREKTRTPTPRRYSVAMPGNPVAPPIILHGFENNGSFTTLVPASSPFISHAEDFPLIAKRPTEFNALRERSALGSHTRRPELYRNGSAAGSLIRRISNAFRSAESSNPASEPARLLNHERTRAHLSPPSIRGPERVASPFSFVGAADDDQFEMAHIRSASASTSASSTEPHDQYQHEEKTNGTFITTTTSHPKYDFEAEEEQLEKARNQLLVPGGNDGVLQRAVSGSIRRFKSMKGAHREFYRSDLDIHSSAAYEYETRRAVDVY